MNHTSKEYYLIHKDEILEYKRKWGFNDYWNNLEYHKIRKAEYWENNRDRLIQKKRDYHITHKEQEHIYGKKYRQLNREKLRNKYNNYNKLKPEIILKSRIKRLTKLGSGIKKDAIQVQMALMSWSKLVRKDKKCVVCNKEAIVAHHLLFKKFYPKLMLNVNNGIPLCKRCHQEIHTVNPKSLKPLEPIMDIKNLCCLTVQNRRW